MKNWKILRNLVKMNAWNSIRRFFGRIFSRSSRRQRYTIRPRRENRKSINQEIDKRGDEWCSKSGLQSLTSSYVPRFDIELGSSITSTDDDNDISETAANNTMNGSKTKIQVRLDKIPLTDRERRRSIIRGLQVLDLIPSNLAQKIISSPASNVESPSRRNGKANFVWVENFLSFPDDLKWSECFLDYLNYRCQSGEILSHLLRRKVCSEDGQKCAVIDMIHDENLKFFHLEDAQNKTYSFCFGKPMNDEINHCSECHGNFQLVERFSFFYRISF